MRTRAGTSTALFLLLFLTVAAPATWAPRGAALAAPAVPAGVTQVASVEGITEYRLANGLRVLLFPDPSKQTTTVNITYLVGSRHEGYGETGMAHLLEHMVFKGSPRHKDIPQELTAHGSRPNGTTWYDRTNYFETFAATEENLDWALDLEADRMVNSFIAKKDLETEFSVVRNEFEAGENYPQNVLLQRMMSTAYLWHNYGKSTIGSREDIERVPIENLQAFYRTWYQPDNAILVVAGKFDETKTLGKIQKLFGAIPRPTRKLPSTWTVEPPQDGERTAILRRVGDVQVVGALYHVPAGSHPDFAAVSVLSFILGDTPSGRLYKALVETQKASSVYGFAFQLHDPGALIVGAEVRTDKPLAEAREALLRAVSEAATQPPTRDDVQRARESLLKNWETTMRNSENAAIQLSEWSSRGDWRLMFVHRDRLEAVTPDDVLRVAQTYLKRENQTLGEYHPTQAPARVRVPDTPDVMAAVKDYKGRQAMAVGEEFDPAPAAIEARLQRRAIDPGIKLSLLPKKTRGGTVNVSLNLRLGDEASLQNRALAAEMAGGMLMRGTTKKTRQQIRDEADRLKAQVNVFGRATVATATIETTRENLAASLRLVAEVLREPSFPEAELELLRQEMLTQVENQKSDPQQKAFTALQKHLYPWPKSDPRYTTDPDERSALIKAVKLADLRAFHQGFYGASAGEIAVVGDFEAKDAEALVRELFGGWKSRQAFKRLATTFQERPVHREAIKAPDKENAIFTSSVRVAMRDDHADYPAMVLGNFMTGGGFLNSRLPARLRQKEGISYGVGSGFFANPFDHNGEFQGFAIYAPQNREKVAAAYQEEIARILDKGFTAEEIADAKTGWLQSRNVSRATDRELASTLSLRDYYGRTLAWDEAFENSVQALTGEQILKAMKTHIDPAKISFVQAGDWDRAKPEAAPAVSAGAPK
ncbi:MAG: M16 family metallopeptidase [Candidatus Eiseniibacteriota bacterium]